MRAHTRRLIAWFGALVAAFGLTLDYALSAATEQSHIGPRQWLIIASGALIVLGSLYLSDRVFRYAIVLPALTAASTYATLLAAEVILRMLQAPPQQSGFVEGLFTPDPMRGYGLSKSFTGIDDDGYVRATYRTNSRGDRDDELIDPSAEAMLLIGDSFTFGLRLDEGATIDKQIESITNGRQHVYNLGVPGYGPPAIRMHLEANDWFTGGRIVYLFCNNDLSSIDLQQASVLTAFHGYIVPKFKEDGTRFSTSEYESVVADRFHPTMRHLLASSIRLARVRELFERGVRDPAAMHEHPPANVAAALAEIEKMAEIAKARGCTFEVALIPSLFELTDGHYAGSTLTLLDRLHERGIDTLELMSHLERADYFVEEGHFNARGARRTAEAILSR